MSLKSKILNAIGKNAKSPAIAAGIGVVGVIAVAVSASRDTLKAQKELEKNKDQVQIAIRSIERHARDIKGANAKKHGTGDPQEDFELKSFVYENSEKTRVIMPLIWKCYIPTMATAALTIGAIYVSFRIGAKRLEVAELSGAIARESLNVYRKNIRKHLTQGTLTEEVLNKEDQTIPRDAKLDDAKKNYNLVLISGEKVAMRDEYSGRLFESTIADVREAVNKINEEIYGSMYASLSDFYDFLGLPQTSASDDLGWNADHPLQVQFGAVLVENKPVVTIDYEFDPFDGYSHLR